MDLDSGVAFTVTFIYALHTDIQRRELWRDLSVLKQTPPLSQSSWVILGDFNQIHSADVHYSVEPYDVPLSGMADLRQCFKEIEVTDLASRGVFFTWSNCRPADPIFRKLDRVVVNEK